MFKKFVLNQRYEIPFVFSTGSVSCLTVKLVYIYKTYLKLMYTYLYLFITYPHSSAESRYKFSFLSRPTIFLGNYISLLYLNPSFDNTYGTQSPIHEVWSSLIGSSRLRLSIESLQQFAVVCARQHRLLSLRFWRSKEGSAARATLICLLTFMRLIWKNTKLIWKLLLRNTPEDLITFYGESYRSKKETGWCGHTWKFYVWKDFILVFCLCKKNVFSTYWEWITFLQFFEPNCNKTDLI